MATKISQLTPVTQVNATDLMIIDNGSPTTGYNTKSISILQLLGVIIGNAWAFITLSPNNVVPVYAGLATGSIGAGAFTNIDIAIVPKGSGAVIGNLPDNGTAGGNKRGTYAVDWQLFRTANTQVASGNRSTISGGERNTASNDYATIGGGQLNQALSKVSTIGGGSSNVINDNTNSVANCTIGGGFGNTITLPFNGGSSTISGGTSNVINANQSTVGGGSGNQITGSGINATIGGGASNSITSSNAGCTIAGGTGTVVSGTSQGSSVGGGNLHTVSGNFSCIPGGNQASDRGAYAGMFYSGGKFVNVGDAQRGEYIQRQSSGSATPVIMGADGASTLIGGNRLALPDNSAFAFVGDVVARDNTTGNAAFYHFEGLVKRGAGAATIAFVGSPTITTKFADAGAAAWAVTLAVSTADGTMNISVTGAAGVTTHWVATIRTTEVQG